MRKTDLLANVSPEPKTETVTGNLFFVKRQPVLEITWINDTYSGQQHIRHFVWKGHWATYRGKLAYQDARWTSEQLGSAWESMPGYYYFTGQKTKELREAEQDFMRRIGEDKGKYLPSVEGYEMDIYHSKQSEAMGRKEKRINRRVSEITPPLPKGFIQWARKQYKHEYVYLLQNTRTGIVDRRFLVEKLRDDDIAVTEFVRGFSHFPGQVWDEYYYGERTGLYGRRQTFWDKKSFNRPCDRKGILYPGTLSEISFSSICASYAVQNTTSEAKNWGRLLYKYQTDGRAERIVKSGYPELIREWESGSPHFTMLSVGPREGVNAVLDVTKGRYRLLRKLNGDGGLIYAAQQYSGEDPYFTDKEIKALNEVQGVERKKSLAKLAMSKHLPIAHLITLLKDAKKDEIGTYKDYLDMAARRGSDIHDEIIYRNKRWREFHDRYVEEANREKNKKRFREVNRRFKKIKAEAEQNREHFGWECENYIMLVPGKASEIVQEGQKQHHCVGASDTYMDRMNSGKTFILFLRKKEEADIPYYTIEAKYDGDILQAYSAYDKKPDWKEVDKVLKKWKTEMKKRVKEAV